MNQLEIEMLRFARARKQKGFTHFDFNQAFNTTCSTARLSDLRAKGYVFKESVNAKRKKRFWFVSAPKLSLK